MNIQNTRGAFRGGGALSFLAIVLIPIFAFTLGWTLAKSNTPHLSTELTNADGTVLSSEKIEGIDTSLLRDAIEIVRKKYVDPDAIDPEKIKYGIVRGMVWTLDDPYSEFMSPKENADFEDDLNGDLEGIGAELTIREGVIVVVSPLRDSPAERAGLLPKDIILKVDGVEAPGEDFLNVVKRIRGKKGSDVTLSVFRPDTSEEKEITITRDNIRVETVTLEWQGDIAVLQISQFGTNTTDEFYAALDTALAKNPKGIILDLRFNSGGFLEKAVDVVSAFKKTGKVVIQKGRPPQSEVIYTTGNLKTDLPLVVLQNGGSASASEIVAGALQDLGRAVVVGEQSFGKGTVQELVPMQKGASLRITIAKWLTPNERDIGKVGITPDVMVKRTIKDFENEYDPQMEAAVKLLNGADVEHVKNEYNKEKKTKEATTEGKDAKEE